MRNDCFMNVNGSFRSTGSAAGKVQQRYVLRIGWSNRKLIAAFID
jgi:hypothetical protein